MKRSILAALFSLIPFAALAEGIKVEEAYVPLAPPTVSVHAAYLTLKNASHVPRSLIGVSSEGYAMAHVHNSVETDGVMTMTMVHQLEVPPHSSVDLRPGSFHIMLMKPKAPLKLGQSIALVLEFANGETVNVSAAVKERDERS